MFVCSAVCSLPDRVRRYLLGDGHAKPAPGQKLLASRAAEVLRKFCGKSMGMIHRNFSINELTIVPDCANRELTQMEITDIQPLEGGRYGLVLRDDRRKPCVEFSYASYGAAEEGREKLLKALKMVATVKGLG